MTVAKTRVAFFDVDNTLINCKSLLSFLDYMAADDAGNVEKYRLFQNELGLMFAKNVHRQMINRHYFSILRGKSESHINLLGAKWVCEKIEESFFFNEDLLQQIKDFKQDGYQIVLVTGSFPAILEPLNHYIGADDILCTTPEVVGGVYTGEIVGSACIGQGKREAVLKYAVMHNVCIEHSWAFGDDETDIPMLESVGNGVRVECRMPLTA